MSLVHKWVSCHDHFSNNGDALLQYAIQGEKTLIYTYCFSTNDSRWFNIKYIFLWDNNYLNFDESQAEVTLDVYKIRYSVSRIK